MPRKTPVSEAPVRLPAVSESPAPLQCQDCGNVPLPSEWPRRNGEEGWHSTGCDAFGPHSHHDTYVLYVFTPPAPPPTRSWDPKDPTGLKPDKFA